MNTPRRIAIIAAPSIKDPITQQQAFSQGRFAQALYSAIKQRLLKSNDFNFDTELIEFVPTGDKSSSSNKLKIETPSGNFTSLVFAWEYFKKNSGSEEFDLKPYDILVAGTPETARFAVELCKNRMASKVVYVANHLLRHLEHWGIEIAKEDIEWESHFLNEIHSVVFPSKKQNQIFLTYYAPAPTLQMELIPQGVPELAKKFSGQKTNKPKGGEVVLFMASPFHDQSDYLTALYALRKIIAVYPEIVTLHIAGGPAPNSLEFAQHMYLHEIIDTAAKLNILENITFLGELTEEEMAEKYRTSHITLVTSVVEAFGHVAIESLSCGTPVVATDTGACSDFIRNNDHGYVCPPRSPEIIADSLLKVLSPTKPHRKTEKNTSSINIEHLKKFTWSTTADAYISLFSTLLSPDFSQKIAKSAACNTIRQYLRGRLQYKHTSIRQLEGELGKSFESIRRIFDQNATPTFRWSSVEPIARHLCPDKKEYLRLEQLLKEATK